MDASTPIAGQHQHPRPSALLRDGDVVENSDTPTATTTAAIDNNNNNHSPPPPQTARRLSSQTTILPGTAMISPSTPSTDFGDVAATPATGYKTPIAHNTRFTKQRPNTADAFTRLINTPITATTATTATTMQRPRAGSLDGLLSSHHEEEASPTEVYRTPLYRNAGTIDNKRPFTAAATLEGGGRGGGGLGGGVPRASVGIEGIPDITPGLQQLQQQNHPRHKKIHPTNSITNTTNNNNNNTSNTNIFTNNNNNNNTVKEKDVVAWDDGTNTLGVRRNPSQAVRQTVLVQEALEPVDGTCGNDDISSSTTPTLANTTASGGSGGMLVAVNGNGRVREGDEEEASTALVKGGSTPHEREYVPLYIAKEHIARAVRALRSTKARHAVVVKELDSAHCAIERNAQEQFVSFVNTLRQDFNKRMAAVSIAMRLQATELTAARRRNKEAQEDLHLQLKAVRDENMQLLTAASVSAAAYETEKAALIADMAASMKQARATEADTHVARIAELERMTTSLQEELATTSSKSAAAAAASAASATAASATVVAVAVASSRNTQQQNQSISHAFSRAQVCRQRGEREALVALALSGGGVEAAQSMETVIQEEIAQAQQALEVAEGDDAEWVAEYKESHGLDHAPSTAEREADTKGAELLSGVVSAREALWVLQGKLMSVQRVQGVDVAEQEEEKEGEQEEEGKVPYPSASAAAYNTTTSTYPTTNSHTHNGMHRAAVVWGEQLEDLVDALLGVVDAPMLAQHLVQAQQHEQTTATHAATARAALDTAESAAASKDITDDANNNNNDNDNDDVNNNDNNGDDEAMAHLRTALVDADVEHARARAHVTALLAVSNGTAGTRRAREYYPLDAYDVDRPAISPLVDEIAKLQHMLADTRADASHAVAAAVAAAQADMGVSAEAERRLNDVNARLAAAEAQVASELSKLEHERAEHAAKLQELQTREALTQQEHEQAVAMRQEQIRQLDIALEGVRKELDLQRQALDQEKLAVEQLQKDSASGLTPDSQEALLAAQRDKTAADTALQEVKESLVAMETKLSQAAAALVAAEAARDGYSSTSATLKTAYDNAIAEHQKQIEALKLSSQTALQTQEAAAAERIATVNATCETEKAKSSQLNAQVMLLQQQLRTAVAKAASANNEARMQAKLDRVTKDLDSAKNEIKDLKARLRESEKQERAEGGSGSGGSSGGGSSGGVGGLSGADRAKLEKKLRDAEKKVELYKKQDANQKSELEKLREKLKESEKEGTKTATELRQTKAELAKLGSAAQEAAAAVEKSIALEAELKQLKKEFEKTAQDLQAERTLRRKYYNEIEDLKGKIRVYCRARPLSNSEKARGNYHVVSSGDEYSMTVEREKIKKEFQFDHVFMENSTQSEVYEDVQRLIQSAVDGYNVCVFAYGQTGSGKTFTMIGDCSNKPMQAPGLAPRAFEDIFKLIEANKSKFRFEVSTYMIEIYCDKLIDLFAKKGNEKPLIIRKDEKGIVEVKGAEKRDASSAEELYALFEMGSASRHTAKTLMNDTSSRSHLVVSVLIKSTSLIDDKKILLGKLSLVDLAGSERAGKTGATGQQLQEGKSINKSLSALGNVIAALSTNSKHVPYRDNILTELMQDSLGGNAKTLMFVNVSPADYNFEETVMSLTYAARVKLITNDAQKNSESKEIAKLKKIIERLRAGDMGAVEEEEAESSQPPEQPADYVPPTLDEDGY